MKNVVFLLYFTRSLIGRFSHWFIPSNAEYRLKGQNRFVTGLGIGLLAVFLFCSSGMVYAAGDGEINPLDFKTDTAIWTAIVFLLWVTILGTFAFKPIAQALDKREQSVADNIAAAEKANVDAKELLQQYQQKLTEAHEEVKQILDAGKKEAEAAGLTILEKAKLAAESERVRATKEIEAATTGALQELAEKSATLATTLAGKIIKTKIDATAHRDLIDNAIQGFKK